MTKRGYKQSPEHIAKRIVHRGPNHCGWKGNSVTVNSGRRRARTAFPILTPCENCGRTDDVERHHKDANTLNNDRSNIAMLCPRCHMKEDGRYYRLAEIGKAQAIRNIQPPKNCLVCGRIFKPLRRGRCECCDWYFRTHGAERTKLLLSRNPRWSKP